MSVSLASQGDFAKVKDAQTEQLQSVNLKSDCWRSLRSFPGWFLDHGRFSMERAATKRTCFRSRSMLWIESVFPLFSASRPMAQARLKPNSILLCHIVIEGNGLSISKVKTRKDCNCTTSLHIRKSHVYGMQLAALLRWRSMRGNNSKSFTSG